MNSLSKIVGKFSKQNICVIGDLMADYYIFGDTNRISPEAPMPVVLVKEEKMVPGGASNVAANVAALGGRVTIIGLIGEDSAGKELVEELRKRKINTAGVISNDRHPTIQKFRVIARGQQLVRYDKEISKPISKILEQKILKFIKDNIQNWDAIVISDYAKGLFNEFLAKNLIATARKHKKPVVSDPKFKNFSFFKGSSMIAPNKSEVEMIMEKPMLKRRDLELAGKYLSKKFNSNILITLGPEGMILFENKKSFYFPSRAKEIFDVTGAGDTVMSGLALSLASGATLKQAAQIANSAAGIVVGKIGTATVSSSELINSLL
ncbi:MAG: D-glycero-beta-D-manno-heptose-7-phosphate kinase [Patescibacteria group bacterium]